MRVRKAVNMAINKKAIIDAVFLSAGVPATNPIPPSMWSYNKAIKDDPYDPAAAKKLLADAGYPNGFTTDLWAMPVQRPYNPNARRIAELMQADLAKVGVTAEIKSFEWGEYRKRMQNGEHQMGMLGWTGDNGDPDNFLAVLLGCDAAKSNGSNVSKWCYQPFEDLIQKAKTTSNQKQRTELYEKAQVIFKEQAPWFTIAHAVQLKPVRKEVDRLQALAVRAPHVLRRRHQGVARLPDQQRKPWRYRQRTARARCGFGPRVRASAHGVFLSVPAVPRPPRRVEADAARDRDVEALDASQSGIPTILSQCSRVRRRRPAPSAPSTHATGPLTSASNRLSPPASAPRIQTSRSLRSRSVRARLVTVTSGTVSAAPLAALATVALSPTARSFGTMSACAPNASALRRQAPRLCGSVTPSSTSSSAGSVERFEHVVERDVRHRRIDRRHDALMPRRAGKRGEPVVVG